LVKIIAHMSDPHIGPMIGFGPRHWRFKRLTGYANWQRRRRHTHLPETLAALVADMHEQAPDHIVVTGDLTNIGLPAELERAEEWLRSLGAPGDVTVIPGNHDIYVPTGRDSGVVRWIGNMHGMSGAASGPPGSWHELEFPFVRRLGHIALIGLNSALPMPPFVAAGRLGNPQIERLASQLDRLGAERLCRIVLIHHPPLEGQAPHSRGLRDAADLQRVLGRYGADLVLHGHNHVAMVSSYPGPHGRPIPVVGVPSASLGRPYKHEDLARYDLISIAGQAPPYAIEIVSRGLSSPEGAVTEIERRRLA